MCLQQATFSQHVTTCYNHPVTLARTMHQPSAPLLESRKAALHVLQIWIRLAQRVTQPTDAKGTHLALRSCKHSKHRGLLPDTT